MKAAGRAPKQTPVVSSRSAFNSGAGSPKPGEGHPAWDVFSVAKSVFDLFLRHLE
jgi:hypothetical protein